MSQGGRIFIRGFAAPFGLPGRIDEGGATFEMIAPYAFNLAGPIGVQCLHDGKPFAKTTGGTLRLDQTDHGLRFEAAVPGSCDLWAWIRDLERDRLGVSVQFAAGTRQATRTRDQAGEPMDLVTSARINHIAIVHNPVYSDTSCWLSTWHRDDMPARMRMWAERWGDEPPPANPPAKLATNKAAAVTKIAGPSREQHLAALRDLAMRFDRASQAQLTNYVTAHRGDPDFDVALDQHIRELGVAAAAGPR